MSLWLNPGHGVADLLKVYAHCIDGQADAANQRIGGALARKTAKTKGKAASRHPELASRPGPPSAGPGRMDTSSSAAMGAWCPYVTMCGFLLW